MVDEKRRGQHQKQPKAKRRIDHSPCRWILDVPNHAAEWAPLPEQQDEREAAGQHVGAALGGRRYHAQQQTFERRPRHHAVLDGEEGEQPEVDQQRRSKWRRGCRVERLRHHQVTDETHRVEVGQEEHEVGNHPVHEHEKSAHHMPPLLAAVSRAARLHRTAMDVPGCVMLLNCRYGRSLKDGEAVEVGCQMSKIGQFDRWKVQFIVLTLDGSTLYPKFLDHRAYRPWQVDAGRSLPRAHGCASGPRDGSAGP